jgi:hypothetical protein
MEIEIRPSGAEVSVAALDHTGQRADPHPLGARFTLEGLGALGRMVGAAIAQGKPLADAAQRDVQDLHAAVFQGSVRDMLMRLWGPAQQQRRLLLRLALQGRELRAVPWEALCEPGTGLGFVGSSPWFSVARSVAAPDPMPHRAVRGAFRVLAIAPSGEDRALRDIQAALGPQIASGAIEWMDPIVGAAARTGFLLERLRFERSPHVIHFVGHGGVDRRGDPILRLADEAGEAQFVKVELLAQELADGFRDGSADAVRLVYLESCEGALAADRPSAAELLVRAGVVAVVAHAYEVDAPVARAASRAFYLALVEGEALRGDVASTLNVVRRTLLGEFGQSAESFSPVLHLRGPSSILFDFPENRRPRPPDQSAAQAALPPPLRRLFADPFSLVLGDVTQDHADLEDRLRKQLEIDLAESNDARARGLPLAALVQRFALRFGSKPLAKRFEKVLRGVLRGAAPVVPRGLAALARTLRPGVHTSLLWLPLLERAVAAAHPEASVYVVQVSGLGGDPVVLQRLPDGEWEQPYKLPREIDLRRDFVVLRLYGGYAPDESISPVMLTDDDHFQALISLDHVLPAEWGDAPFAALREPGRPVLFAGLSVLDRWRHRVLLSRLFVDKPLTGSVALLPPDDDPTEQQGWEEGKHLPIKGNVVVVRGSLDGLADALAAVAALAGPSAERGAS